MRTVPNIIEESEITNLLTAGLMLGALYATFWLRLLLRAAQEQFNWARLNLTGTE